MPNLSHKLFLILSLFSTTLSPCNDVTNNHLLDNTISIKQETDTSEDDVLLQDNEYVVELDNDEITENESDDNTEKVKVTYRFVEMYARNGIGSLSKEVLEYLPKEEYVNKGEIVMPPDIDVDKVGNYTWTGWAYSHKEANKDIIFDGIWKNEGEKKLSLRSSGTYNSYGATWNLVASGYAGTHEFGINGNLAFCLQPHTAAPPESGYEYYASSRESGTVADIIGNGMLNGASPSQVQATVWNYVANNKSFASAGGADVDWESSTYKGKACTIQTYASYDGYQVMGNDWKCDGGGQDQQEFTYLTIAKYSTNPSLTNDNPDYSLEGARIDFYNKSDTSGEGYTHFETGGYSIIDGKVCSTYGPIRCIADYDYWIKETVAPKGFKLNTEVFHVKLSKGENYTLFIPEEPEEKTGFAKLKKIPAAKEIDYFNLFSNEYSLANAEYIVYTDNKLEKEVGKLITTTDGTSNTLQLDAGTYYVKENKAPKGFKLNDKVYTINVVSNETATIEVIEEPDTGNLTLKKLPADKSFNYLDSNNYSLTGAIYNVYADDKLKTIVGKLTTTANGDSNTLTLPVGTYYVKEDSASKGFKLDNKTYTVNIKNNQTIKLESIEEPNTGNLTLKKLAAKKAFEYIKDNNSFSLAGAIYNVYSDSTLNNLVGKLTTTVDGSTNTLNLPIGTYYVKEVSASKGFKLDSKTYTVDLKDNQSIELESIEEPLLANLSLKKKQANSNYDYILNSPNNYSLADAIYEVFANSARTKKVGELKTNSNGNTNTLQLPLGTYYIKEKKASKGFILDNEVHVVKLEENNKTYTVDSIEQPIFKSMDLTLIKQSSRKDYQKSLADAQFTLNYYDTQIDNPTGDPKYTWVFRTIIENEEAKLKFDKEHFVSGDKLILDKDENLCLPIGTFTLQESKAPEGYALDNNINVGTIKQNKETAIIDIKQSATLKLENNVLTQIEDPQYIIINIQKFDKETREAKPQDIATLKGAEFEIKYLDNNNQKTLVAIAITDENGFAKIDKDDKGLKLLPGTYYIKEIKAPNGYLINYEEFTLEAKTTELNIPSFEYQLEIADDITQILVHKVDSNGDYVNDKGVELQLLDDNDNVVYSWISDGLPRIIKGLITNVKYRLHETLGTPLYKVSGDKEIEVNDNNLKNLVMVNKLISIKTSAKYADGSKNHVADGIAKIIDTVEYQNLYEGSDYILRGELVNKLNSEILLTVDKPFVPESENGTIDVEFKFNLDNYDNHDFVVFETLYMLTTDNEGNKIEKKIIEHKDLSDDNQTIHVDRLYRADLKILKVDAKSKKPIENVEFNIDIKRNKADGILEEINLGKYTTNDKGIIYLKDLKQDSIVTLKELSAPNNYYIDKEAIIIEIGHDENIKTIEKTIINHLPEIKTLAKFKESASKNYVADGIAHIVDTVSYKYLNTGKQYLLSAELIDKNNEEIIASREVKYLINNHIGELEVTFEINLDEYANHDFVVYETLYLLEDKNKIYITEHKDLNDSDQTVHIDELYNAEVVLYKTNTDKSIKLNGAIFNVKTKRTKLDGSILEKDLGKYITGGIYLEDDKEFEVELAKDEEFKDIIGTYKSELHNSFNNYFIAIRDLQDGEYYVKKNDSITKHIVAKGAIILEKQYKDTLVTYTELISPNGYHLNPKPFTITVGSDEKLKTIENYRINNLVIIPKTGL